MNILFIQQLTKLGLSEKEATTFVALLSLGSAPVQTITKRTGFNRSTTYVILDSLTEKGFITQSSTHGKLFYEAANPKKIELKAKERAEVSMRQEQQMLLLLPELDKIRKNKANYPKTRFFEGKEGIKTIYQNMSILDSESNICGIASPQTIDEYVFGLVESFVESCVTRGLLFREIQPYNYERHITASVHEHELRYIPKSTYPYSSSLYIFMNRVIFVSLEEEFGVILESKEFADVMREAFELAWVEAGRLDKSLQIKSKRV
jgi:sugar-specific transcriptional regulator TrmB